MKTGDRRQETGDRRQESGDRSQPSIVFNPQSPAPRSRRRRQGFTLIEMMVTVTIVGMAFALIWMCFGAAIKAWRQGQTLTEDLHHGDFVMDQLVSSLRSAVWFKSSKYHYGFELEKKDRASFPHDRISWVTSSGAFLPPGSPLRYSLHRMEFSVDENSNGVDSVAVRAWSYLAEEEDIEEAPTWNFSDRIRGFSCRVYDYEQEDWVEEWEKTNSVPGLLEITLFVQPADENERPIEVSRAVEIPVGLTGTGAVSFAVGADAAQAAETAGAGRGARGLAGAVPGAGGVAGAGGSRASSSRSSDWRSQIQQDREGRPKRTDNSRQSISGGRDANRSSMSREAAVNSIWGNRQGMGSRTSGSQPRSIGTGASSGARRTVGGSAPPPPPGGGRR